MALILCIETSTKVCSVALLENEELLGSFTLLVDKSHAEQLAVLAQRLLESCQHTMRDLDAVAVASGPGSYTGLRIGTSFAKGICYALDVPLLTIGSLEALAEQVLPFAVAPSYLIPMMDARRMEVYLAVLDNEGKVVSGAKPFLLEEESLSSYLDIQVCYFFGNGSDKARSVINHDNARFIEGIYSAAAGMGRIACRMFRNGEFADLAYFEPDYLKEFRATKPKKLL